MKQVIDFIGDSIGVVLSVIGIGIIRLGFFFLSPESKEASREEEA